MPLKCFVHKLCCISEGFGMIHGKLSAPFVNPQRGAEEAFFVIPVLV